jgi:integrase/recombinase XerD
MSRPKTDVHGVRVVGPLAPFVAGFRAQLREAGYTAHSSVNQLRVVAHLSRWLDAKQLGASDLSEDRVGEFVVARRTEGYAWAVSRRGLVPLLDFLAGEQVLPIARPVTRTPVEVLLDSFRTHLLRERGLAASTTAAYVEQAGRFLARCAADGKLTNLTAGDITGAVLAESAVVSVGSAKRFVVALRSFLGFCCIERLVEKDLSAASLAVTGRRRSSLPRGIDQADVHALLQSCDRRRAVGRRDHAVLLTLLRLGLRASEVACLTLDDIDWRAGEILVHGKGRRDERLPLPADVGEAVADYLRRGRPGTNSREVFVRAIAPIAALGRGGVSWVVRRACRRAGLAQIGAHRLRHTLACELVAAGVPLPEIGQVLRHRSLASTAIYARADIGQLRAIAQVWLGGSNR